MEALNARPQSRDMVPGVEGREAGICPNGPLERAHCPGARQVKMGNGIILTLFSRLMNSNSSINKNKIRDTI